MSQPPPPPPPPEQPPPSSGWSPGPPSPYGAPYGGPPAGVPGYGKNDGMAVAALVCGILSFVCFGPLTGIAAIILGVLSRNRIDQSGGSLTGRGMATAGLVLGSIAVVLTVVVLLLLVLAAASGELDDTDTLRSALGVAASIR